MDEIRQINFTKKFNARMEDVLNYDTIIAPLYVNVNHWQVFQYLIHIICNIKSRVETD